MKLIPHQLMELNSPYIWSWSWFTHHVALAKQHGFNGIIVHLQEMMSLISPPSDSCFKKDVSNIILQQKNTINKLRRMSDYLQQNNMSFWIQGEAAPVDEILRLKYPEANFNVGLTSSFWSYFYEKTFSVIIENIPHFDGVILSLNALTFQFDSAPDGLHHAWKHLRHYGKKLILRNFIDTNWPRNQLASVLSHLSTDIRASLKATEFDYHPGFANNPMFSTLPNNKKWIEFDLWGIGYGWSALPCYLGDDIRDRIGWAKEVAGDSLEAITARVSWQYPPDLDVNNSINAINLSALNFANNVAPSRHNPIDIWLQEKNITFRNPYLREKFISLYPSSYSWMEKVLNIMGRRLHSQSLIPETLPQLLQLLHLDARSANWNQSWQPLFPQDEPETGESQKQLIYLEKEHYCFSALTAERFLLEYKKEIVAPSDFYDCMYAAWQNANIFSQMYAHITDAVCDALLTEHYQGLLSIQYSPTEHHRRLHLFAERLQKWCASPPGQSPDYLPLLLSAERMTSFADSLLNEF